jgi:hypothetical protein
MIRQGWIVAYSCFLLGGFAIAAARQPAVDGRWQGTVNTADGSLSETFNFKTEGQILTGTGESPIVKRSISEGKVDGDKIFFKTTVGTNTVEHKGTISGDTIELKNFGPYGEFDETLKRVSEKK